MQGIDTDRESTFEEAMCMEGSLSRLARAQYSALGGSRSLLSREIWWCAKCPSRRPLAVCADFLEDLTHFPKTTPKTPLRIIVLATTAIPERLAIEGQGPAHPSLTETPLATSAHH